MKTKYLPLLFIIFISVSASCKKEKSSPILGKWRETKLRIYQVDSTNTLLYDTTYLHPFTSFDYLQFNVNNTVTIGNDHYYYLNAPGLPKAPQAITPVSSEMNYAVAGAAYVLTTQSLLVNPGGFDVRDTVTVQNLNTLQFRSVFYAHVPGIKIITDSYYTK